MKGYYNKNMSFDPEVLIIELWQIVTSFDKMHLENGFITSEPNYFN